MTVIWWSKSIRTETLIAPDTAFCKLVKIVSRFIRATKMSPSLWFPYDQCQVKDLLGQAASSGVHSWTTLLTILSRLLINCKSWQHCRRTVKVRIICGYFGRIWQIVRDAKSARYGRYICAILSEAVLIFGPCTDRNRNCEHCAVRSMLLNTVVKAQIWYYSSTNNLSTQ